MKNPDLKIKYAKGLGDIIACFLHSRLMTNITFFVTGKKEPCSSCSVRRNALNVIFPIHVWRLFFKNEDELLIQLKKEYEANGFKAEINGKTINTFKGEQINILTEKNTTKSDFTDDKYILISENVNTLESYMIKIQIFKEK
jgi:hypothetical protein